MNSEVRIRLVGDSIPTFTPIGAAISYGINRVPTAMVELDPTSLGLLCDFDSIRRSPVDLYIDTTAGCLHFHGLIDGLSFNQTPGGLQSTLVLKHPFQWLDETFPRIMGVHPSSRNVFRPQANLKWNLTDDDNFLMRFDAVPSMSQDFDFKLNLVDFFVRLIRIAVKIQKELPFNAEDGRTQGLQEISKEADLSKMELIELALNLIDHIDTSATKGLEITAADGWITDMALQQVANMSDSILRNIWRALSDIGCCMVIGNDKAYIIPEASYLNVPKIQSTHRRKRATIPNTVFPAEYDNVLFNDNGYVNIKGVYVLPDQSSDINTTNVGGNVELGYYVDESTHGNIMITSLPAFISFGLLRAASAGGKGLHNIIKNTRPLISKKIKIADAGTIVGESSDMLEGNRGAFIQYINQWAQMEYCRLKYDDRTGSISTAFHSNWAPGAVGSLYTRLPGTYMDFFVTDVTHSFHLSAPSGGKASTTVNFKSGRIGPATSSGLDVIDLYKYDYTAAQKFCGDFIKDIST